jgi:hypothetical protein
MYRVVSNDTKLNGYILELNKCGLAVRCVSLSLTQFSSYSLSIDQYLEAEHNAVVRGVVWLTENVSSIRRL